MDGLDDGYGYDDDYYITLINNVNYLVHAFFMHVIVYRYKPNT
jgi:hypothetical protein